ncbi:hypothetical protein [Streptomyces sp. NPDC055056]
MQTEILGQKVGEPPSDEGAATFAEQKRELEGQWNRGERADTEDLRLASGTSCALRRRQHLPPPTSW